MSIDATTPPGDAEQDESVVSRAELQIAREKIQIERERLALERERLAAERERWKSDADLKSRAEGRGIAFGTLVFVGVVGVLAGVIAGAFLAGPRASQSSAMGLETLVSKTGTNEVSSGITLRPVNTGSGKAYLLILN